MKSKTSIAGAALCTLGLAVFTGFAYLVEVPAAILVYILVAFDWMNLCDKYDGLGVKATCINFVRLLIVMGAAMLFHRWWIVFLYFLFSVSVGEREEGDENE